MNNSINRNCPICYEDTNICFYRSNFDDRYGYPGLFTLIKCNNCKHIFSKSTFSERSLSDLYSNYYPRSTYDLDSHKPFQKIGALKSWIDGEKSCPFRWVPKNVKILDIGCGFGESLGYHQDRGCEIYGVEVDSNIQRVAERYGYIVDVGLFDHRKYDSNYFDYVTMNQVIEHVLDPIDTLQGIARILKPSGKVILSTPNASGWGANIFRKYWINWHAPYHLHFFSKKSINLAAIKSGLLLSEAKTITHSEWLYYQWLHIIMYPENGKPSPFWSPNQEKTFLHKIMFNIITLIHKTKINHLITRTFDAIGYGDNLIFILTKRET